MLSGAAKCPSQVPNGVEINLFEGLTCGGECQTAGLCADGLVCKSGTSFSTFLGSMPEGLCVHSGDEVDNGLLQDLTKARVVKEAVRFLNARMKDLKMHALWRVDSFETSHVSEGTKNTVILAVRATDCANDGIHDVDDRDCILVDDIPRTFKLEIIDDGTGYGDQRYMLISVVIQ